MSRCCQLGGNLLLNVGPRPDGTMPETQADVLRQVGKWLERNGEAVYGRSAKLFSYNLISTNRLSARFDRKTWYLWIFIWPTDGQFGIGGFFSAPERVSFLVDGTPVRFEYDGYSIKLKDLPEKPPIEGAPTVLKLEFEEAPEYVPNARYPQLNRGIFYPPGK